MRIVRFVLLPAALLSIVAVSPAEAAEPASGTLSPSSPQVSWSGGPLPFTTFSTHCQPVGPTCDEFALTVQPLAAEANDVVISAAAASPSDVIFLHVYGPDGTEVGDDVSASANPQAVLRDAPPGAYRVLVEGGLSQAGTIDYKAVAAITDAGATPDAEIPCNGEDAGLGPPPQAVLDAALADDGRNIRLDVLVLLEGVEEAYARTFFEKVAIPYAELNITVVPTFRTVPAGAIRSDVTTEIIDQTQDLLPGRRVPDEFDVVELLTNRDIEALGQKAVAGQAKCIGGAAFKEHSFNVSEAGLDTAPEGVVIGPLRLIPDQAAKITAHEIGHLFGGQHHFANCVEGGRTDAVSGGDSSPCTLMFNSADFISLHFGTVNGRIIRGYALLHAAANDVAPAGPAAPGAGESGGGSAGGGSGGGGAAPASAPRGTLPATGPAGGGGSTAAAAAALGLVVLARRRSRHFRES